MREGTGQAPDRGARELEVGRVGRPHGLKGEVRVELWGSPSRLSPGSVLSSQSGRLKVVASRAHHGSHIVSFEGVADRDAAGSLRGLSLMAGAPPPTGELWVHELIGRDVVDASGKVLGQVAALEPNPASDLLVLADGALVPLVFVSAHDPGGPVVVDVPPGLLD
ncbi:MAG: ribosome maturation factor RimM [Acidimicrobiales bacterium]